MGAISGKGSAMTASQKSFAIEGMRCAACAARLERVLNRLPSLRASVNFAAAQADIQADGPAALPEEHVIFQIIEKAGFKASALAERSLDTLEKTYQAEWRRTRADFIIAFFCTLPMMIMMVLPQDFLAHPFVHRVMLGIDKGLLLLAALVQFWCGRSFYRHGWASLRGGGASMDVLVALGTSVAFAYSAVVILLGLNEPAYLESSAMVITLVLLGRLLEMRARHKAGEGVQHLLQSQPQIAHKEQDGSFVDCPVSSLKGGEILLVRPGEAIPVDGEVSAGASEIDESALTGESVPVLRQKGDKVFAATLNRYAALQIKVLATGRQTAFARIVQFVEQAQGSKAQVQRLADRVASVFVPVIILIAALCFIGTFLWLGQLPEALIRAVAVLVVACPCALGLATPTAIMVGTARGSEKGILFRDAGALERMKKITALAFDKTGTLSLGQPVLVESRPSAPYSDAFLRGLALMLERQSEHPLAKAVREGVGESILQEDGLAGAYLPKSEAVPGKGIRAELTWPEEEQSPQMLYLGTRSFLQEEGCLLPSPLLLWEQGQQEQGRTTVFLTLNGEMIGGLAFEDQLRPEAGEIISWIKAQNITPVMITGDNSRVAQVTAQRLEIEQFRADVLPEQKAAEITALQKQGFIVGMVGDGINDAPALSVADTGIALGSGSAMALETADIILMKGGLSALRAAFQLSGATLRRIYQNLFLAFLYNIICVPLAVFGLLTPVLASAMMALSSVLVVSNALLLRLWKEEP